MVRRMIVFCDRKDGDHGRKDGSCWAGWRRAWGVGPAMSGGHYERRRQVKANRPQALRLLWAKGTAGLELAGYD